MNRKISIEEVRSFLAAANRQFERGGIRLHSVRIHRPDSGNEPQITLNYSQDEELHRTDPKKPTESAK